MQKVSVGLIQTSVSEDLSQNLRRTVKKVGEAISRAPISSASRSFTDRYTSPNKKGSMSPVRQIIPGESTEAFSALARSMMQ